MAGRRAPSVAGVRAQLSPFFRILVIVGSLFSIFAQTRYLQHALSRRRGCDIEIEMRFHR
jgi:hypothetical protein